ncbi:MAG: cyclodeaminase/cyclohydrolase family protein [Lachnospiraceae bacterium]|nr:cyclodeaminase/cyclohydrolase family protein [Lachnospiraceae bacterium]MDD7026258.1 cyclodeaminase/cyclohydrolase family protein [Lachnospiraceae bacterium]MDY5699633.1 cyclodeaminase/cyclohydrolase family protein [Lachnospiraceae bacterium]
MEKKISDFLAELSSKEPVPGGGGAAALIGSLAASLCAMVANLTTGKKKYACYQEDIDRILDRIEKTIWQLYGYVGKDAEAFAPLAEAYSIPKEEPKREEILQKALLAAATVPLQLAEELYALIPVLEELEEKGSRLAISDVAVAATACRAALEGAVMNVYINTGLMKDEQQAAAMNERAQELTGDGALRCQAVYERIEHSLCMKK